MLRFLSVNNITRAAAKTGTESTTKTAVNKILHTNNGIWVSFIPAARIPKIVTRMLIEPKIELKPLRCKLKIARSTDAPEC